MAQSSAIDLNCDGISLDFFNLLWTKDELNFGPSVNIPDTVVFRFGKPVSWYFTSKNGKIKKKNRQNLMNARVEEGFLKHLLGYDVVATYISMPVDNHELEADAVVTEKNPTIEFFDRKGLNDFLYHRGRSNNGILQKFIEPKGVKNEAIRAIWSPKVCLLERCENIHQLHDHRYGLFERCVCFEGPDYYSASAPLRGQVLAGQIQKACEALVAHISEVTFAQQQVSRIVLTFKVDSRDKVWLLYSTSIRVNAPSASLPSEKSAVTRNLVNIDSVISLPESVNLNPNKSYEKFGPSRVRVKCISCSKESLETMRHPVSYKSIVKHYEHVLHLVGELAGKHGDRVLNWPPDGEVVEAAGGVGFGCIKMVSEYDSLSQMGKMDMSKPLEVDELKIPPIIRYIHPKLSAINYSRCRKDPLFLYKTVTVCESCYLVYAEFTTMILRLGQDLSKLLKPDPSVVSFIADSSTMTRPSSADWRAISSVNKSTASDGSLAFQNSQTNSSIGLSSNHKKAKKNAIGLRSSDAREQPNVPLTIRKGRGFNTLNTQSVDSFVTQVQGSPSQMRDVANNESGEDDIHALIAEREKAFFREISLNPQLKDQHPLMHLISAQQKLKMVDQQSGILNSKASSQKKSIFGTEYGKQAGDNFNRYKLYEEEQPCILNGKPVLLSELRKEKQLEKIERAERKKRKKLAKLKELKGLSSEDAKGEVGGADAATIAEIAAIDEDTAEEAALSHLQSVKESGAKKHYGFLQKTLQQIEGSVAAVTNSSSSVGDMMKRPVTTSSDHPFSPNKSRGNTVSMEGFADADFTSFEAGSIDRPLTSSTVKKMSRGGSSSLPNKK